MRFNDDHEHFRTVVREFVEQEINPHVDAWEAGGMMPLHEVFGKMGDLGMLGLEYDPAFGGQGADHLFTVILAEEFGRADHGSIGMALGVHVAAIRTRAVRDGDEWVINGSKTYITNSLQADWLCLLARTSDDGGYRGMSQIVVPTDAPGFAVSEKLDKLGMRASDTGLLTFTDCRVPVANTIGVEGAGFQQQMAQFVLERMWANYSGAAGMERALHRTADYVRERVVFGRPLLDNQFIQYRLAELTAEVDMLKHYNYACAEAYMAGDDPTRFATIAKIKAGRLGREVADWCLQFHGGIGYMEDTWTSRYFRDTRLLAIGGGSDETMLQVLARLDGLLG